MDEDETELKLKDFVENRCREMKIMMELSAKVTGNNAPQQQLPRHMRRRAASHNVKRLPLVLRQKFMNEQLKSGLPVRNKRPSRKHRRRPKNLFSEYAKRSRKVHWMETHIWHAKRFHMGRLWRCCVPLHRNDRGVRAAYRDSKMECLISDLSWMQCVEVVGEQKEIVDNLSAYMHRSTGVLMDDTSYLDGQKKGRMMMYSKNGYPHNPICMVSFIWAAKLNQDEIEQDKVEINNKQRNLYLWIHPSSFNLLLDNFITDMSLKSSVGEEKKAYSGEGIKMIDRSGDFNCFRLIGSKAQSVLFAALKMNQPDHPSMSQLYKFSDQERSVVEDQVRYWQESGLTTHHFIPPHSILSLLVEDPRLSMPIRRIDSEDQLTPNPLSTTLLKSLPLAFSPLWNFDKMTLLKEMTLSTHKLNELKAGSSYFDYKPSVPVVLMHNPSSQTSASREGGWDVVVPMGWGMFFWLAFVYQGARSIGLKELNHINFERQQLSFPSLFPDIPAGKDYHLNEFKMLKAKYERMPPAKRCNYVKYNASSPFHFPFHELCNMWVKMFEEQNEVSSQEIQSYFVIRDLRFLREIKNKCDDTRKRKQVNSELPTKKVRCVIRVRNSMKVYASVVDGEKTKIVKAKDFVPSFTYLNSKIGCYLSGLVCIHLTVVGKGTPKKFAIIYLPCEEDYKMVAQKKPLEAEKLKKCPRNNKVTNKAGKKKNKDQKKEKDDNEMCLLPVLDEKEVGFSSVPQRLVIGYVLQGGFSFGLSKGAALGFVTLPGLLKLINTSQQFRNNNPLFPSNSNNFVLIRDTNSLYCRYATCSVLTDIF